jgi:hypothetical protein
MSWSESKAEANQYMLDLGIEAKANTSSSKLSGMYKFLFFSISFSL